MMNWLRHFLRNVSGQITLSFALLALPLCLTAGSALDYGMLVRARTALQSALDSATLAAAAKEGTLDPAVAKRYFSLNGTLETVRIDTVEFTKSDDGSVTGKVTATIPAVFMKIVRSKDYKVTLTSSAKGTFPVTQMFFSLTMLSAKGSYDKVLYWTAVTPAGQVLRSWPAYDYDYYYDDVTKSWKSRWVQVPDSGNTWKKGEGVGVQLVSYVDNVGLGRRINPDVMNLYGADNYNYVKASSSCTTTQGMTMYWEETHDPRGDFKDMIVNLKCIFKKVGPTTVGLTK